MPKLLVVDDEVDIGELITELAEDRGIDVRAVSDSAEVAGMLDTFAPDAIMLDLMMPGTDGVELLKTLADKVKGARIALMSGTDARVLNSARRLGSAHGLNIVKTLEKPLEISVIRAALDELMATAAAAPAPAAEPNLGLALAAGQVQVFIQPVIATQSGKMLGVEVLPRWPQADGRVLTPADFLTGAVDVGLLAQLTRDMFLAALPSFARLSATSYVISFNVAPAQLDGVFADWLAEQLRGNNIQPAQIALECNEAALLAAPAAVVDVLAQLRLLGVQIWMDEFAARASIADMQRLPLAGFKLEKGLAAACEEPAAQATVKAALALAHALDRQLIAVGVENERQRGVLSALGVDGLQGNAIKPPFPLSEAARNL
jgi:EAL domain-containing protein (putative c-di-GMP-specific phosphodiesterase class I)